MMANSIFLQQATNGVLYELYAVIVHEGSINCGHYYAYVNSLRKHDEERWPATLNREVIPAPKLISPNWYKVSDEIISDATKEEVLNNKNAYILFYEMQ